MPTTRIPIGQNPYYNIDPISKGAQVSDSCIDGYIDESGSINRRVGLGTFKDTSTGAKGQGVYFWEQANRQVVVTGGKCFSMDYQGILTDISGNVTFGDSQPIIFTAANKTDGSKWLYMADGGYPIYTTGGDCVRIDGTTGSPATVSHIGWLASRVILLEKNSRKVYASDTDPATGEIEPNYFLASENPLTAEAWPDDLVALFTDWDEAYFIGTRSIEVWRDDNVFFSPVDGAAMSVGCAAPYSIVRGNNTFFMVGIVDNGMKRSVVQINDRSPNVISLPIEKVLDSYTVVDDAIGFLTNNSEYILTFPTEGVTWCYDYLREKWYQWSYWNQLYAKREEFIGRFSSYAWGKLFMLSRQDGKIFHASREYADDNGTTMRTEYVTGNIDNGTDSNKINKLLRFKIKRGATTSYTEVPHMMVRYRDNGDLEWKREFLLDLGTQGQRAFYRELWALGMYRSRQYSFVISDDNELVLSDISEQFDVCGS